MLLGWLLGIVLEPFTSGEAGRFVTYAGAISAFFTGYGAGKLDDLIKYIFNPQNLSDRRKFQGGLFLASFVIALIVVYQARFGVYPELSITTDSPLTDAVVNKAYEPTRIEASGGTPPLKWEITPALPAGLSLDRNIGVISGTPEGVSSATKYRITVTDSAKPPLSKSKEISLEVLRAQNQELHSKSEQLEATNRQLQAQNQELHGAVERLQHEARFVVAGDLLFLSGGYQLSAAGKTELDNNIVPMLKGLQNAKVVVYGYTDNMPVSRQLEQAGIPDNLTLSLRRAGSVVAYLISQGVNQNIISAKGFGETHPVGPNDTPADRKKNRRIIITVQGPDAPG